MESPSFTDIFAEEDDLREHEREDTVADARHVLISGHRYTRRRQDTNRAKRARQQVRALPSVMAEREWVAVWIELIDASVYTPPGTPRAGRILREAYADASIRLPVIRDLGRALLPRATAPAVHRPMAAAPDVVESVPA
ncbi:MAG TPA: hypothetical protein VGI72_00190 [Gaiellales bacterium]|jgi:hypothetical protein